MEEKLTRVATGHLDCCGDMIRRGDSVVTKDGEGWVVWVRNKWWITYPAQPVRALNHYPSTGLRRCDKGCDNKGDKGCDRASGGL